MLRSTISSVESLLWKRNNCCYNRNFAIYAMGEGWTGALGTSSLDTNVAGHEDEEEASSEPPVLVHDGQATCIAAGWGHSALVVEDKLLVCGRPQEFQSLLRLKRIPAWVRQRAVQHTWSRTQLDMEQIHNSPSIADRVVRWMVGQEEDGPGGPWEQAKRNTILPNFTQITLPNRDVPSSSTLHQVLDASAGVTAIIGTSGTLYTFGINHRGQCGVGYECNNIWTPQPVMGLSTELSAVGRDKLEQEFAIKCVALGLQHGVAVDVEGNLYSWGKGERGQLGQGGSLNNDKMVMAPHAVCISQFPLPSPNGRQHAWIEDSHVVKVAAGMNHSAALLDTNHVYIWGKNVAQSNDKVADDATSPMLIQGLPPSLEVLDIACGSHHTSILLEDGSVFCVGITSDRNQPIFQAVELVPPNLVTLPCRLEAHFDRTTLIDANGTVWQVHLWTDEELQEDSIFTPPWVDHVQDRIQCVQRGWLHTIVSTDNNNNS